MQLRRILTSTLLFFLTCHLASDVCADVSVEASISRTSFSVNQMAQLTITVNGASRNVDIDLPQLDNIQLHNRGKSSQINMINGSVSSSTALNYLLQAEEPGDYTLPSIQVSVSGTTYQTAPIAFTVTAADQKNADNGAKNEPDLDEVAFLRVTGAGRHYPGEIVPITVKAYFSQQYRFDEISLPTLQADGIASPQIKENPTKTQETVNSKMYHVLTWKTTLSGVKAGKQKVKFTLDASLLIPQQRLRSSRFGGSLFDDSFFSDFFGGYERRPITLQSNETDFTVLALPTQNKPDNFTGAIGTFDLEVTASPLQLAVGEPITLRIKITGTGNFDRVVAPVFPEIQGWKTYPPTTEQSPEHNGEAGSKVFEQAIVARDPATQEIPALSFSFFDPVQKTYTTRLSAPIPIHLQDAANPGKQVKNLQPRKSVSQDIVAKQPDTRFQTLAPIHLETGTFQDRIEPLYQKSWYLLGCAAAVLAALGAILLKWQRLQKSRNPEIEHARNRKLLLKKDLQRVTRTAKSGDYGRFLEECRKTIQHQLGMDWEMEPGAICSADLSSRLPADSPLLQIFSMAETAAYGAVDISEEEIQVLIEKMSAELERLL